MQTYKPKLSTTMSIPAPIGGWNARDSLAAMEPMDAPVLENFWPLTTDVMFRLGYTQFAYGLPGQVETLMWYSGGTSNKFFCASGGKIWNITAGGDFSAASPDLTGLSNNRFQYLNQTTPGGSFMHCVNGVDKLRGYNGSVWWVDGDGTHDITGFDTATAASINLHQNRLWFAQKNSLKAYYLATNSMSGAATLFDLSSIAKNGGYLLAMATWTIDAGYGLDDLAVFITSNGEIIVYKGYDPASITTWQLVGVFSLGSAIGRRCSMKYAGDLLVMTQDGLVPMAQGLQSSRFDPRVNLTDKIQQAISEAATLYSGNFGWEITYYAKANMLIINIPVSEGSQQQQFCMNTISKAWCKFTGINANCIEIYKDDPYFGGNGFVGQMWNGNTDYPTDVGISIKSTALQAFNYCQSQGQQKQFKMIRPILSSNGQPAVYANVNVDYDLSDNTAPVSFVKAAYSSWDSGVWDGATWGGGLVIQKAWQGVNGIGFCVAPVIKASSMGIETHWMASDIVFSRGGVL